MQPCDMAITLSHCACFPVSLGIAPAGFSSTDAGGTLVPQQFAGESIGWMPCSFAKESAMSRGYSVHTLNPSRKPLAACVASLFMLSVPAVGLAATTWPVTSCADGGPGSLRAAIAAATTLSGDTVDLSGLAGNNACADSKISLTTGDIAVTQDDLTIQGPGSASLTIDGAGSGYSSQYPRLLTHTGAGKLTINDLSLAHGHIYHVNTNAPGGCIYSKGDVETHNVQVSDCQVQSVNLDADGGAIYAQGNVRLFDSTVAHSSAFSGTAFSLGGGVFAKGDIYLNYSFVDSNKALGGSGKAKGGGLFSTGSTTLKYSVLSGNSAESQYSAAVSGGGALVSGDLKAKYSTITANVVHSSSGLEAGGGVTVSGSATISNSTFSDNVSYGSYGGIFAFSSSPAGKTFSMRNSTISGNVAFANSGAVYVNSGSTEIYNSTIAFNKAGSLGPGLSIGAFFGPVSATLRSNIFSNNHAVAGNVDNDLETRGGTTTFNSGPAFNLIRVTNAVGLPGDTAHGCPYLGPLRNNGGLTMTHALTSGSPAIDNGDGDVIDPFVDDQRGGYLLYGSIDYLRVSGPAADIGAYEVQQDDVILNTSFDGCG